MADLLTDMRDYLIAQGLVRDPLVAGSAPPLWRSPREGVPAPGEGRNATEKGDTLVIAAFRSGGIASTAFESSVQKVTVDIYLRATKAPIAEQMGDQLRDALTDKRNFVMGSRTVIACDEWRALQPLSSDEQAFTYVQSVLFWLYA
jgi:hypothetical protein